MKKTKKTNPGTKETKEGPLDARRGRQEKVKSLMGLMMWLKIL